MFLGLTDWKQRPRIVDPRQRAVHGFLPSAESETGFMIVCDETCTTGTEQAEIIDVAPSLIELLGCRRPASNERQAALCKAIGCGRFGGLPSRPLTIGRSRCDTDRRL